MNDLKTININQLSEISNPDIIDIREKMELASGVVPGSKHIPMMGLIMNKEQFLDKGQTYYIYCAAGGRSMQTCTLLADAGYDVVNLDGGFAGYRG